MGYELLVPLWFGRSLKMRLDGQHQVLVFSFGFWIGASVGLSARPFWVDGREVDWWPRRLRAWG